MVEKEWTVILDLSMITITPCCQLLTCLLPISVCASVTQIFDNLLRLIGQEGWKQGDELRHGIR